MRRESWCRARSRTRPLAIQKKKKKTDRRLGIYTYIHTYIFIRLARYQSRGVPYCNTQDPYIPMQIAALPTLTNCSCEDKQGPLAAGRPRTLVGATLTPTTRLIRRCKVVRETTDWPKASRHSKRMLTHGSFQATG